MIRVEKGHAILKGSKEVLLSELVVTVGAFLSVDAFDEKDIDEAVRLGKMDDDKIHEEVIKSLLGSKGDDMKC